MIRFSTWLVLLVAAAAPTLGGCGGDPEPASQQAASSSSTAANSSQTAATGDGGNESGSPAKKDDQQPNGGEEKAEDPEESGDGDAPKDGDAGEQPGDDAANKEQEKESAEAPKPVELPNDFELWRKDEYFLAKQRNDRRLKQAVDFFGERFASADPATQEAAARMLLDLLETRPADPEDPEAEPVSVTPEVATGIIQALGRLPCPATAEAFGQLLRGELEVPAPRSKVVPAVVQGLAGALEFEPFADLAFLCAAQPADILPDDPAAAAEYAPSKLQGLTISLLNQRGTEALSVRLAKFLDDPSVTRETAMAIETMLSRDAPHTWTAQILLYQNDHTQKQVRTRLEQNILRRSRRALEILLGTTDKAQEPPAPGSISRPSRKKSTLDPDETSLHLEHAGVLWTPDFLALLAKRVNKTDTLSTVFSELALIGSMPLPAARSQMDPWVQRNAHEGPRLWNSTGMLGKSAADPAFLVSAKDVYHGFRRVRVDPRNPIKYPDKATKDQWETSVEALAADWMRQMYTASQTDGTPGKNSVEDENALPVVLHPGANKAAEYHLAWPGDVAEKAPNLTIAPLELHYLHVQDNTGHDRLVRHYKRFAGSGRARVREIRNGTWLDGLRRSSKPGYKLSVDIRILSAEDPKEVDSAPTAIDILTIEVPDPEES